MGQPKTPKPRNPGISGILGQIRTWRPDPDLAQDLAQDPPQIWDLAQILAQDLAQIWGLAQILASRPTWLRISRREFATQPAWSSLGTAQF